MPPDRRKEKSKPPSSLPQTAESSGDITFIRVPLPPATAMNRDRPISELIKAQLLHMQHADTARMSQAKRIKIKHPEIRTEAEAAAYIAAVTRVLHPQGRKRSKRKPRS